MTARPWPENARPTPAQLLAWLRTLDDLDRADEALTVLDKLLTTAETAERCVIAAHDDELTYLNRALTAAILDADRYRRAWHSARRRAADPNHAADVLEALALDTDTWTSRAAATIAEGTTPGPITRLIDTLEEDDPDDR